MSENTGTKRLAALSILLYALAYVIMMLWYYLGRDDAVTVFIFDEPMGVVVIIIQLIFAAVCYKQVLTTFEEEIGQYKRTWFNTCKWVFGFYFISLALIAIVAAFLDPWVQASSTTIACGTIYTIVYGCVFFLLHPRVASEVFVISKKGANFGGDDETMNYSNL